jgi:class 3 adenylate cyclase
LKTITTDRVSCIILTGDLSGFSNSYASGNTVVVEEFIRRFYVVCDLIVGVAQGCLVKYTGDGFLAAWPLTSDFRSNSMVARVVTQAMIALSGFIRATSLDLKLGIPTFLRQGVTVEANAIRVSFQAEDGSQRCDYIGKMVNLAFRIPSLTKSFPYIAAHKPYLDIAALYGSGSEKGALKARPITESEVSDIFKGVTHETGELFTFELSESLVDSAWGEHGTKNLPTRPSILERTKDRLPSDPALMDFQSRLANLCMLDATWLGTSYRRYLEFVISLYAALDV